jgi:hypothetical protein
MMEPAILKRSPAMTSKALEALANADNFSPKASEILEGYWLQQE